MSRCRVCNKQHHRISSSDPKVKTCIIRKCLPVRKIPRFLWTKNGNLSQHDWHSLNLISLTLINCSFLSTDWVVKLGPASFGEEGLYQYSVITDNLQATLFVLARDVDTFKSQYDEEVTTWLAENGFTHFYNKPIPTVQNKKCIYPDKRLSPYQSLWEFLRQK